jgi:G:T-mismatch repair DNA endonuclease (very short patch repair protein)
LETEFCDFVENLVGTSVTVVRNDRTILGGKELDIVIPELRIAFEFNGCYWHHEGRVGKDAHASKQALAAEQGYRLFFVWDDQWTRHREAVSRMVASRLGLLRKYLESQGLSRVRAYARDLSFGELDGHAAAEFMDMFHIQGHVSATRHFALFDGDVPLAVISVRKGSTCGRLRRNDGDWDIQRYATACQVPGGFSKLMAGAERRLLSDGEDLRRWISFSANEVSDGSLYRICGFSLDAELPADYMYAGALTGWQRVAKERFQLRRFRDDASLRWSDGWTETMAASENGLFRCWDCGKKRWAKELC